MTPAAARKARCLRMEEVRRNPLRQGRVARGPDCSRGRLLLRQKHGKAHMADDDPDMRPPFAPPVRQATASDSSLLNLFHYHRDTSNDHPPIDIGESHRASAVS